MSGGGSSERWARAYRTGEAAGGKLVVAWRRKRAGTWSGLVVLCTDTPTYTFSGKAASFVSGFFEAGRRTPKLVSEAGGVVVVDHAGGLHEGVADGGADEAEAAAF